MQEKKAVKATEEMAGEMSGEMIGEKAEEMRELTGERISGVKTEVADEINVLEITDGRYMEQTVSVEETAVFVSCEPCRESDPKKAGFGLPGDGTASRTVSEMNPETAPEVDFEADSEAALELMPEADSEAAPKVVLAADSEAALEVVFETDTEADFEAAPELAPEADSEADFEAVLETASEVTSETDPGTDFEAVSEGFPEADLEASSGTVFGTAPAGETAGLLDDAEMGADQDGEELIGASSHDCTEEKANTLPKAGERGKVRVVGVRFRTAGRIYYFDPGSFEFDRGMNVVVETARGMEYGFVVGRPMEVDRRSIQQPLKSVLRVSTREDDDRMEKNRAREREAFRICRERIQRRGLEMKLIDAEYTFDNSKILFYFTADGRIDFRDLVKDLAGIFRTRIELRQVGVRDETKILGGYGSCGRPLCCHTWLSDFVPVSIKMAKEQNLSLNPAKISGVCGRLMCCLKNESETYEELNRLLPRPGDEVEAADGSTGLVESVNVLRQRARIIVEVDDEKELHEYDVADLTILRRRKRGTSRPTMQKNASQKGAGKDSPKASGKDGGKNLRESREKRGSGESREKREPGEVREKRDFRESREQRNPGELPESRGRREARECRDPRDRRESREYRDPREQREPGESRDKRESRELREAREQREQPGYGKTSARESSREYGQKEMPSRGSSSRPNKRTSGRYADREGGEGGRREHPRGRREYRGERRPDQRRQREE